MLGSIKGVLRSPCGRSGPRHLPRLRTPVYAAHPPTPLTCQTPRAGSPSPTHRPHTGPRWGSAPLPRFRRRRREGSRAVFSGRGRTGPARDGGAVLRGMVTRTPASSVVTYTLLLSVSCWRLTFWRDCASICRRPVAGIYLGWFPLHQVHKPGTAVSAPGRDSRVTAREAASTPGETLTLGRTRLFKKKHGLRSSSPGRLRASHT